ncbi:uncharacterized protein [Gossypium hirsutum]|uniref:Integrase zinc-binding domain-containing protein n=1 Tax=Gossypium hirsutum TaxID=3635 RepID=A0A1U8K0D1_GOSHI|nr:uncharacterized protein LOC107911052 [Gossypium hirsutum]
MFAQLSINDGESLLAELRVKPVMFDQIKLAQLEDNKLIKKSVMVQNGMAKNFSIDEYDCLRFHNRICVLAVSDLNESILCEAHDSPFAIHLGGTKVYRNLRESYWWLGTKKDIVEYMGCHCQQKLVKTYIREIMRLHGILVSIISNRDLWFTSRFWRQLHESLGWECYLPLAKFVYNNSFQSSIQMEPYQALYGRKCRSLVCWIELNEKKVIGPELIQEIENTVKKIRERLKIAFDRHKSYADLKRRDIEYAISDKKNRSDLSHIISIEDTEIRLDLSYKEEPVKILAQEV